MKKTAPRRERGIGFASPNEEPSTREYSEFIRLPHRRPAYAVNAPVLARHICRRLGPDESDPIAATSKAEYDAWENAKIDRIDAYLERVQRAHGVMPLKLFRDADGETPDKRDTLFITLQKRDKANYRLRMRVDLHDEYYTLTMIADGFRRHDRERAGYEVADILCELQKLDCARSKAEVIYEEFWNRVEADEHLSLDELPGQTFADFRGLALCPPLVAQSLVEREHAEIQLPQSELADRRRRRQVDDVLHTFVDTRREFFCGVYGFSAAESEAVASEDANVVMCGMLDGSAIYGSGFGKRAAETKGPLRYFVLYNGFAATQLGRLIRRLHVLGEFRVAALLDIFDLRRADAKIRQLGYYADTIGASGADKPFDEPDSRAKFPNGLTFLSSRLLELGTLCVGGLVYRVNRSEYYAQAYRDRLQDVRIVRIEGWQPYDEFVRRTVFKDFDDISRIKARYEALSQRIAGLGVTVWTKDVRENSTHTNTATRELVKLQKIADLIVPVAFTYYGATVFCQLVWVVDASYGALLGNADHPRPCAYLWALLLYGVGRIGIWLRGRWSQRANTR